MSALAAVVFDDGEELPYTAARLLLTNGAPATTRVLDVLDRVAQSDRALGPLALPSLTERVEYVRAAAGDRRRSLATILGDKQE